MKSIIDNEKECLVCGAISNLHRHHTIYGFGNRKMAEKYGCWVYLCAYHHNLSDAGVHFNKKLDLELKQMTQEAWERKYGNRQDFIKAFGRSWL